MPASNVSAVLSGVQSALTVLYPSPMRVLIRKGLPGPDPASPLCGWTAGDPCPCIVVTCPDPEEIDKFGTLEHICVQYAVVVAYVKPVAGGPVPREDDDDIRQFRQNVRDALYKPTLEGVGVVWGVGFRSREIYTPAAGGTVAVSVSAEEFQCLTNESRGFN